MKQRDLIVNLSDICVTDNIAQEADMMKQIGFRNTARDSAMEVGLVTDKMIDRSHLEAVTSPIFFNSGSEPNEDGLFSYRIFGSTVNERRRQYAYINLHHKFFHPFVYKEILCKLDKRIQEVAAGKDVWDIIDGKLVKLATDDPNYNDENTGLYWLIDHFHELDFKKNTSMTRNDKIKFLENATDDEIFISKWLVIPVFYRDADFSNGKRSIPELNELYSKLISYTNGLKDDFFAFFGNATPFQIQNTLCEIRSYGQKLIEKKHGAFHKSILGKSIDRGSRDVISVPTMNHFERPEDNPVDIFHTGIPVAKCIVLGYNFVLRYCLEFFERNFRNVKEYPVYGMKDGKYQIIGSIPIKDQMSIFTQKYIDKKFNRFINSHSTRFETINITAQDGTEIPMHFSGMFQNMKSTDNMALVNRPMTWLDLFYMAAVDTLSDKYIYTTRYPITSYASQFPSLCTPLSTLKTIDIVVDGKRYKNYPVIDLTMEPDKVATQFIDTLTMSNLFLDALGGDYDGDTVSEKMVFSLEANKEAQEIAESVKSFVAPDGSALRLIKNESYLTFFNMTNHT